MKSYNLPNSDFEKAKEEIIAGLMSRLVIMPFGPFKMTFISPKTESEKVNKEKENVDEVRETKSVEEIQEEVLPKENSTTEENASILLNRDVGKESIDHPEEGKIIVDSPDLEVIDLMEEESKPRTEIEQEKGVTKNESTEK